MNYYAMGLLVGITVALLVIVVCWLVKGKDGCFTKYDERQQRARGIAYRNGFWTLAGGGFLLWALSECGVELPDQDLSIFVLMLGLAVFAVSCVWMDAYLGCDDKNARQQMSSVLLLGVSNLLLFFVTENALHWMNLFLGVLMLILYALFKIRSRRSNVDSEDEEDA